jgi:hypothetical protein
LRYVPYFGETDDVDLTDAYKVEVRSVDEEELLERTLSPTIFFIAKRIADDV